MTSSGSSRVSVLCITDPKTHPPFDTTVELYNRLAEDPRVDLFHLPVKNVSAAADVRVAQISRALPFEQFLELDAAATQEADIREFNLVFSRADKPFPDRFLENLALFENATTFINRPSGLIKTRTRDFFRSIAADFLPDHIVSRDPAEIEAFVTRHESVVAKKNYSYGGKGVFKISRDADGYRIEGLQDGSRRFPSFALLKDHLFSLDHEPFEFVEFLKNIAAGDKRVLVVEGEIYGGFLRRAKDGGWIHNISAGGEWLLAEITPRERDIVNATANYFHELGVYTLGYDFLLGNDGEWILSEINAGNIGGYGRLETLSGKPVYDRLISWMLRKRDAA